MKVFQTMAVVAAMAVFVGNNTMADPADPVGTSTQVDPANPPMGSSMKADTMLTKADKEFMVTAAQCGMTEVKLGELATQKGMREDVKALGKKIVKDHMALNAELAALATQKGVTLPATLDAKHQEMVDKLTALTGEKFDDAYLTDVHKAHHKDAKEFKAEDTDTKDPDIKNFVEKYIPVMNEHLEHINAMKK